MTHLTRQPTVTCSLLYLTACPFFHITLAACQMTFPTGFPELPLGSHSYLTSHRLRTRKLYLQKGFRLMVLIFQVDSEWRGLGLGSQIACAVAAWKTTGYVLKELPRPWHCGPYGTWDSTRGSTTGDA